MIDIIFTSLELGLIYAIVVFGVLLTFRILNFPDLTVDGSFVTGAAAAAIAIQSGISGSAALFFGFVAGFLAGNLTAVLHIVFGISKILAGILSVGMIYTINLRLMKGPNLSLLNKENIADFLKVSADNFYTIIFLLFIVFLTKLFIDWFLQTEFGLRLRATGDSEIISQSFAVNTSITKFLGVSLSNGFVGLAGGLVAQYQGFADVNMGIGTIIIGLAALMIGEALISGSSIGKLTAGAIVGAILYQFIVNFSLRLGLVGTDLKFITSLIVIIALVFSGKNKFSFYGK